MGAFGSVANIQKTKAGNQSHKCEGHADSARPDSRADKGPDYSKEHRHHQKRQQESRNVSGMDPPMSLLASEGFHRKNQQSNIPSQYKNHEKPPILFVVNGSWFLKTEHRNKKQDGIQHEKNSMSAREQHSVNSPDPEPSRSESDHG